jgi:hypothetical protein
LRFGSVILGLCFLKAGVAQGGILSAQSAMRCNASGDRGADCDTLRPSIFEGKFGILWGLDGALNFRTPENSNTVYEGPGSGTSSTNNTKTITPIKLGSSSGLRLGPMVRIHLFDWVGLGLDAGFEGSRLGTESEDSDQPASTQSTFAISYGASYVGASLYLPAQKIDKMGLFVSARRVVTSKGDVTMKLPLGEEKSFQAKSLAPITDVSIGLFLSIFFVSFTVRDESWQVTETQTEKFSPIKSRSSGIEIGLGGPIWYLFP